MKPAGYTYASRSAAVRAARLACRNVLGPDFQAFEGHDYEIHPAGLSQCDHLHWKTQLRAGTYAGPSRFILRGPAAVIISAKESELMNTASTNLTQSGENLFAAFQATRRRVDAVHEIFSYDTDRPLPGYVYGENDDNLAYLEIDGDSDLPQSVERERGLGSIVRPHQSGEQTDGVGWNILRPLDSGDQPASAHYTRESALHAGADPDAVREAFVEPRLSDFTDAFMLCVVGEGSPYIKVQFQTVERAQAFHSVIIQAMGRRELRPFKGRARANVEAQNGLNDTL